MFQCAHALEQRGGELDLVLRRQGRVEQSFGDHGRLEVDPALRGWLLIAVAFASGTAKMYSIDYNGNDWSGTDRASAMKVESKFCVRS